MWWTNIYSNMLGMLATLVCGGLIYVAICLGMLATLVCGGLIYIVIC